MSFYDKGSLSQPITWVQRDDPFLRPIRVLHWKSIGLDSISSMAHLMEDPITKLDHLWVTHSMSQSRPWVSPFYCTLSPPGPSHPMSRITPYGMGHTLQFKSAHKLGHPIEWVAPWARAVPTKTIDFLDLTNSLVGFQGQQWKYEHFAPTFNPK